jgi:hypothetical protein
MGRRSSPAHLLTYSPNKYTEQMIGVKRQPLESARGPMLPQISGKLVIIGVLSVAIGGALLSWWFRYAATHRTAVFWGPEVSVLIRDAPLVESWNNSDLNGGIVSSAAPLVKNSELRDVSFARGLLHMRTALLEDRSYDWPPEPLRRGMKWTHGLVFRADGRGELILFSPDFKWVCAANAEQMLSCEPIAYGLQEMFSEFSADTHAVHLAE